MPQRAQFTLTLPLNSQRIIKTILPLDEHPATSRKELQERYTTNGLNVHLPWKIQKGIPSLWNKGETQLFVTNTPDCDTYKIFWFRNIIIVAYATFRRIWFPHCYDMHLFSGCFTSPALFTFSTYQNLVIGI